MIDQSAQAVQNEAFLSLAATRAGFSMAPRPQVGNVHSSHSVAAMIRPPEVRMTAITREWLSWDDYSDSPRGKGPSRGNTPECGVFPDLLTSSIVAVSEYYVRRTPVRSYVRKDVQTVPRRIKLSRAEMPFSKIFTSTSEIMGLYKNSRARLGKIIPWYFPR